MADSLRVPDNALRLAGLLPQEGAQPAGVRQVFGTPYTVGGSTVIPVAQVRFVRGLGRFARKAGSSGMFVVRRPVALVVVGPEGVRVEPVVDVLPLAVAGMLLVAWSVYWIARTVRDLWR